MLTMIHAQKSHQYKHLIFVTMMYISAMLASAIMVNRVLNFHDIYEPGGILIFPLTYFLTDIITEVYGYKVARYILLNSLICQLFFSLAIIGTMQLPTVVSFKQAEAYKIVLGHLITYSISFAVGTFCGQFLNIYIISRFKIFLKGKYFWLRSLASTTFGEMLFTFITLGPVFMRTYPAQNISKILISAYVFKLIYGLVFILPASILVVFLKRAEGLDVYDYDINYNPFSLKTN